MSDNSVETVLNSQWKKLKEQFLTKLKRAIDKSTNQKTTMQINEIMTEINDCTDIDEIWLRDMIWEYINKEFVYNASTGARLLLGKENIGVYEEDFE